MKLEEVVGIGKELERMERGWMIKTHDMCVYEILKH